MRLLYLIAASDAGRRAIRWLAGAALWALFLSIVLSPFACFFLLGRATAP